MNNELYHGLSNWPAWHKIIFRFFFVYFVLYAAPWEWIGYIPFDWIQWLLQFYYQFASWLINAANSHLFHLYKELVPPNGSGDTSFAWIQLWLYLLIAFAGCIIWSVADRKRANYNRLAYWFRIMLRCMLIFNCFGYGYAKVFLNQMGFPSTSEMATPLGDLLPMRLSWMFVGASPTYQFYAGMMEVIAGVLLLFRRTSFAGTLLALGIFVNVVVMNLGYDIPVKLFSIHLTVACIVLLAFEYKRVSALLFNKPVAPGTLYTVRFSKRWQRNSFIVAKVLVVIIAVIMPFIQYYQNNSQQAGNNKKAVLPKGQYEVRTFVKNGDTLPYRFTDTLRWNEVIIENGYGSIGTKDTSFRKRYGRGYFRFSADSSGKTVAFSKGSEAFGTIPLGNFYVNKPDSNTIILSGNVFKDSIYAVLVKFQRHYPLSEKQFHWLSEYNR